MSAPIYVNPGYHDPCVGPEAMTIRQAPHLGLPSSPKTPLFYLSFGYVDPQFGWLGRNEEQLGA